MQRLTQLSHVNFRFVAVAGFAALLCAWSPAARAQSFTNPQHIVTPGGGYAYPYGQHVSGVVGTVKSMTVTLNGFTGFGPQADMVLLGPNNQRVMLMSDCGSESIGVSDVTITFDDFAAGPLPQGSMFGSGTYKPTNYDTNTDSGMIGTLPYGTALSAFNGINPNGNWTLYIHDDTEDATPVQVVRGWTMTFNMVQPGPNFVVSSPEDGDDGSADAAHTTLREAIRVANANPDASTITFAPALAGQTIALATVGDSTFGASALVVNSNVTIVGLSGASGVTVARAAGAPEMRLFRVAGGGGNLTLRNLTLSGGVARGGNGADASGGGGGGGGGLGGAIFNEGTLQIEYCTLSGNSALGGNGGNGGVESTSNYRGGNGGGPNGGNGGVNFPGNGTAGGFGGGGGGGDSVNGEYDGSYGAQGGLGGGGGGGGAYGYNGLGGRGSFAPITGALAGHNRGGGGGGLGLGGAIANKSGAVTLVNSTVAANTVTGGVGGVSQSGGGAGAGGIGAASAILNYNGSLSITHGTVAGEIYSVGENGGNASVALTNTILESIGVQVFGGNGTYTTSGSNNLIRNNDGFSGGVVSSADPLLGTLQNNGGPTATMLIPLHSPARDGGTNSVLGAPLSLTTDQRGSGFVRLMGPHVDIGAVEAISPPYFSVTFSSDTPRTNDTLTATASTPTPAGAHAFTYVWSKTSNGTTTTLKTTSNTTSTTDSLDLATAGHGDRGDVITLSVTAHNSDTNLSGNVSRDVTVQNTPPVAVLDTPTTLEDTAVVISVLDNDTDADGTGSLAVIAAENAGKGSVSTNGTTVTYTPPADFSGTDSFSYTVSDTHGGTETGFVTLTIYAVNDAPTAVNDALSSSAEDAVRTISFATLTGNDSKGPPDESNQALTVNAVSNGVGGTVAISGANVVFTPAADFNGTASFSYSAQDNGVSGAGNTADFKTSNAATVSFTMTPVNDAPTVIADTLSDVAEDSGTRTIPISDLLANDIKGPPDESGETLVLKSVSTPVGGTVAISGSNVLFTLLADFNGVARFSYTVEDNGTTNSAADPKTSSPGEVSFNVTQVNDPPTLNAIANQIASATVTKVVSLTGITSGAPYESQTLTITASSDNTAVIPHPTVSYTSPATTGSISLTPATPGSANIMVTVNDGSDSNAIVTRTFQVTVGEVPSLVVSIAADTTNANDGQTSLREAIDYASTLTGTPTVTFAPGLTGSITLGGQLVISRNITIAGPGAKLLAIDGNAASRVFNITAGNTVTIQDLTIRNGKALGTNGDNTHGGAIYNAGTLTLLRCAITGNRAEGFSAAGGIFNTGALTMNGCTVSHNWASDTGGGLRMNSGTISLMNCTFAHNEGAAGGGIHVAGGTANVRHCTVGYNTSRLSGSGRVGGIQMANSGATLNLHNSISAANVNGEFNSLSAGSANNVLSAANARLDTLKDNGGPTQTIALLAGSTAIDAGFTDGTSTDQRGEGFARPVDHPTVTNRNGSDGSDIGAHELQRSEIVSASDQDVQARPAVATPITLVAAVADESTPTFSIVAQPTHGTLSAVSGNQVTYTSAAGYQGSDSFTFRAQSSGGSLSNIATVRIAVAHVNHAPVAANENVALLQNAAQTITLGATDEDGDVVTYAIVASPAHGTLSAISGNQITYTPAANYVGADSFTFRANDGVLDSNTATIQLTVNEAPSLVVNSLADATANDGVTSLREAVAYARTLSGSPAITVTANGTITLASELVLDHDMTITGPATISGGGTTRVFRIGAATVTLANLTIGHGRSDYGAGIKVENGNVTLNRCVLANNVVSAAGGAIHTDGTLTLNECTISDNKAEPYGAYAGGIRISTGTVEINRSTLTGNNGTEGAAILNNAWLTVRNSTITANESYGGAGGGIYNQPGGTLLVDSSTIVRNTGAGVGAGIFNYLQGSTTIGNSIVALNTAPSGPDVAGNVTSADYNLFGSAPLNGVAGATSNNIVSADPRLDLLKDNGGATHTIALLPNSPAYENGDNTAAALATDQRAAGFARQFGSRVDIGAFESQQAIDRFPIATVSLSSSAPKTNDTLTATATATDADNDPVTFTYVWKRNGAVVRTTTATTSLTDALDLSDADAGDKGDGITVELTPNDGKFDGGVVSAEVTVANTAPLAGRSGSAVRFDGVDDYVRLPDNLFPYPNGSTLGNDPISFEAFFKTTTGGVILGQQTHEPFDSEQNGWVPAVYVGSNGRLHVVMFQHFADPAVMQSSANVNDGAWHHVAVTYDGTSERFYLDGALQGSRNVVQVPYSATYTYALGVGRTTYWPNDNGHWYPFNGMLDEVRIWNRARTAAEIASSWNKSLGAGEGGLLAYYRFDETSGASAFDYSGNARHGTFMNGAARQPGSSLNGDFMADQWSTTLRDTAVNGTLAGSDADDDALTFSKLADCAHGTVVVHGDGSFTYTAENGYTGPDSFTFRASDGSEFSNDATVTINVVVPPNAAPVASADTMERYPYRSASVPEATLLANDSDADGNLPLTLVSVSAPASGQASVTRANGYVFYDPAPDFTGADSFTYTIADALGATSTATVSVNVLAGTPPPALPSVAIESVATGRQSRIGFTGVPGRTYRVQYTDRIEPELANWQTLQTITADAAGNLGIIDPPPLPPQRFYRVVYP